MTTPYYTDDLVTLYHGRAEDYIDAAANASVDLIVTDPPYDERTHTMARSSNVHAPAGGRALSGSLSAFESWSYDKHREVFARLGQVTRGWVISNLPTSVAFRFDIEPPDGLRCLRVAVWVKTNPMPIFSADRPAMGWEPIVCLHRSDVKPSWNDGGKSMNHIGPKSQTGEHPTQKPIGMLARWIEAFTAPASLVLDPFAGSGSSLVAAKMLGRKAIGVEIDERYCEIAARRLLQDGLPFGGESA